MTNVFCQCGKVKIEVMGAPILAAACFCKDCQQAGHQFEAMAAAPPVLDEDGGTGFVLYRKDKVQCHAGAEQLAEYRLAADSATRRVLASCCNSPMFLDFEKGHWLTLYRNRFGDGAPPIEMRVMTDQRSPGVTLPDDVPNYGGHAGRFFRKLMLAWLAMGFRRPMVTLARTG